MPPTHQGFAATHTIKRISGYEAVFSIHKILFLRKLSNNHSDFSDMLASTTCH